MKLIYAYLVWGGIAALLGTSLWILTVKGAIWPLAICLLGFVIGVGKIGCKVH